MAVNYLDQNTNRTSVQYVTHIVEFSLKMLFSEQTMTAAFINHSDHERTVLKYIKMESHAGLLK